MADDDGPMSVRHDDFSLEVIKLFLQVAWADHEISEAEREALIQRALRMGISEAHLEELGTYLRGEAPLPPPNLGLLKRRKLEVLKEVKQVLQHDLNLGEEEQETLKTISELLS